MYSQNSYIGHTAFVSFKFGYIHVAKTTLWFKSFRHQFSQVSSALIMCHVNSGQLADDQYWLSPLSLAARTT